MTPAFADHSGPWLPIDVSTLPAQSRAVNRGVLNYCFDGVAASYPNFRSQAAEVANFAAGRGIMPAREVPVGQDCDVYLQAPSHNAFVQTCGSGAYGCIYYWHDPVDIYYDLQGPNAAFYNNSVLCHEGLNTGHMFGLHEQYNDRDFKSNGRDWTCMDFGVRQPGDLLGRNVWALPDWDRDRVFNVFVPDAPSSVSLTTSNGWATVKWSQERADGGAARANGIRTNSNATHMGFGWATCDGCPIENVGNICPASFNYCASAYKDGQRSFDSFWRGCLYVRSWNNGFGNIPQVSAPNYWLKAGCW